MSSNLPGRSDRQTGFWPVTGNRVLWAAALTAVSTAIGMAVVGSLIHGRAWWVEQQVYYFAGRSISLPTWLTVSVITAGLWFALVLFHAWTTYADAPRKLDRPSLRLLKESLGFRLVVLPEGVLADTILWPRLVGIYQGFPVIIDFEEKQLRRHAPVPKLRLRILTSAGYRKGLMTRPHLEQTQSGNSDELWNIGFTRMWRADDFEPLTLVEWEKILRGATDELRTIGFAPAPPDWKFTD